MIPVNINIHIVNIITRLNVLVVVFPVKAGDEDASSSRLLFIKLFLFKKLRVVKLLSLL